MKTSFARFSLACALALAMSAATAQAATSAQITRLKGSAEFSTDGQSWTPLAAGSMLSAGSVIRTAPDSYVDVLLGEGKTLGTTEPVIGSLVYFPESGSGSGSGGGQANLIRINESSVLSIDTLTQTKSGMNAVSETQLDLRKGSIFFSVKKLSAGSIFEIKCPKAVAGVRGTLGWMNSDGLVRLGRGTMAETYRAPDGVTTKTQIIQGRQSFDPNTQVLQAISDELFSGLIRALLELVHGAGVRIVPTTLILDPNILVTSPVNQRLPGVNYEGDRD